MPCQYYYSPFISCSLGLHCKTAPLKTSSSASTYRRNQQEKMMIRERRQSGRPPALTTRPSNSNRLVCSNTHYTRPRLHPHPPTTQSTAAKSPIDYWTNIYNKTMISQLSAFPHQRCQIKHVAACLHLYPSMIHSLINIYIKDQTIHTPFVRSFDRHFFYLELQSLHKFIRGNRLLVNTR